MIESNLLLIVKIDKSYTGYGMDFLNMFEEENIGLIHSLENFEPKLWFRFLIYSNW
jgi:RNA polymerase nonessential primary-like sigma factor